MHLRELQCAVLRTALSVEGNAVMFHETMHATSGRVYRGTKKRKRKKEPLQLLAMKEPTCMPTWTKTLSCCSRGTRPTAWHKRTQKTRSPPRPRNKKRKDVAAGGVAEPPLWTCQEEHAVMARAQAVSHQRWKRWDLF